MWQEIVKIIESAASRIKEIPLGIEVSLKGKSYF